MTAPKLPKQDNTDPVDAAFEHYAANVHADPKLPQLADGSSWVDDVVVDSCGNEISIADGILFSDGQFGHGECEPLDALAVIRRAGLDTEYDALRLAAKELSHELDDKSFRDVEGTRIIEFDDIRVALKRLEALL
jgi:hypothetical protein